MIKLKEYETEFLETAHILVEDLEGIVPILLNEYMVKLKWSEVTIKELGVPFESLHRVYSELLECTAELFNLLKPKQIGGVPTIIIQPTFQPILRTLLDKVHIFFVYYLDNT